MPTYRIQAPDGRTFRVQGDGPPSEAELESIFAAMGGGPTHPPSAEDFIPAAPDRGSAVGRFASGVGEMLNPIAIAGGLYNTVRHPIDTGRALVGAHVEQLGKARDAFGEGRYSEAVGHGAAGLLPVVGPIAADIGEQIGQGDIAGGMGRATGLLAPFAAKSALQAAKSGAAKLIPTRAATKLEQAAADRVAEVMSPRANTNVGRRMGNKAQKIAPELAKDAEITGHWSREGMAQAVAAKLEDATQALDAAGDARLAARTFDTQPILDALKAKRADLTAKAVEGSKPAQTVTERASSILDESGRRVIVREGKAVPIGADVTPAPLKARAAQLDQAISEIDSLGPVARYDDLKLIRQAYDGPAKTVYNPSMTADYLAKQGESLGAADVTGTLREALAKMDPETAAANAQYSLYRNAHDILQAATEIERVRPKVGRQIMTRLTATLFGGQQAGVAGGVAGFLGAPVLDQLANAGVTTKLQTAKLFQEMATAIRRGDVGRVASQESRLRALLKTLGTRAAVGTAQATQPGLQSGSRP